MTGSDLIGSSWSDLFGTEDNVNNTIITLSVAHADLLPGRRLTSQTTHFQHSCALVFNLKRLTTTAGSVLLTSETCGDRKQATNWETARHRYPAEKTSEEMDDSACFSNTRDQKFVFCFWVELSRKCVKDLFFLLFFFLYTRLFHASRTPVNSGHFAAIEPAF